MRKPFLLSLLVALLTTLSTHAYSFQSGDLYYYTTSETTVTVTYQESWSESNYQGLTTATIPATVTYNGTTYFVTSIGVGAFELCSSLTSVTIPNSVTSIGTYAFNGCSSLTSIVVESGNTMYDSRENCNAIIETASNTLIAGCQSTIIPNSVTSIGNYAFYGCSSLTSITIGNSVTSIGDDAFNSCSSLTSITLPNSVASIGELAFNCVPNVVYNGTATGSPWGARSVNGYVEGYLVYADETKTTLLACSAAATGEVTLPNSVTSIGADAFFGCSSLTSITIPNSVTSIGRSAFFYCSSLTSITIPNSVTSIGEWAFYGCSALTSITIPNSVTSIGYRAFVGCTSLPVVDNLRYADTYLVEAVDKSLSTYTIKAGTKWIGDYAFSRCSSLTSITIPNSITSIGERAFSSCSSLTSITLPNSVTSIGNWAFEDCTSLTSITIPNSVTSIGDEAFAGCSSLTSVTIGNSVTSIGEYAFSSCSSLADIYCYATTPPMCDTNTFDGVSKHCYIHVPAGTIRDYQMAAGWRDFYHFYEISELPDGTPTDQVGVTVTGNYATFSWPVNPTASSYTLTITKDGEVFCTLIFNNMGQLVGMAFAPARNGKQSANQDEAQSTAYGFSFVVTNLDANSHYTYTFTVNGADNEVIETYNGTFDTSDVTALSETEQANKPSRKILRNGQVLILRNGVTYDMMGNML